MEAEPAIVNAIRVRERGDDSSLLAEALTTKGSILPEAENMTALGVRRKSTICVGQYAPESKGIPDQRLMRFLNWDLNEDNH